MSLNRLPSAVERAFEIARSSQVGSIEYMKTQLDREGCDQREIYGKALCRQLHSIIRGEELILPVARKRRMHRL